MRLLALQNLIAHGEYQTVLTLLRRPSMKGYRHRIFIRAVELGHFQAALKLQQLLDVWFDSHCLRFFISALVDRDCYVQLLAALANLPQGDDSEPSRKFPAADYGQWAFDRAVLKRAEACIEALWTPRRVARALLQRRYDVEDKLGLLEPPSEGAFASQTEEELQRDIALELSMLPQLRDHLVWLADTDAQEELALFFKLQGDDWDDDLLRELFAATLEHREEEPRRVGRWLIERWPFHAAYFLRLVETPWLPDEDIGTALRYVERGCFALARAPTEGWLISHSWWIEVITAVRRKMAAAKTILTWWRNW